MSIFTTVVAWRTHRQIKRKCVAYLVALANTELYNRIAIIGDADARELGLAFRGVPPDAVSLLIQAVGPSAQDETMDRMRHGRVPGHASAEARLNICETIDKRARRILDLRQQRLHQLFASDTSE